MNLILDQITYNDWDGMTVSEVKEYLSEYPDHAVFKFIELDNVLIKEYFQIEELEKDQA